MGKKKKNLKAKNRCVYLLFSQFELSFFGVNFIQTPHNNM